MCPRAGGRRSTVGQQCLRAVTNVAARRQYVLPSSRRDISSSSSAIRHRPRVDGTRPSSADECRGWCDAIDSQQEKGECENWCANCDSDLVGHARAMWARLGFGGKLFGGGSKVTDKQPAESGVAQLHAAYELHEELGRGAYGRVVRAVRRSTGEEVAVKVIAKGAKEKEDARLQVEVDILRRVRHPNLIRLHDVFDTPDTLYLVMQLCRGGELFDRIIARKKVRATLPRRRLLAQDIIGLAWDHVRVAGFSGRPKSAVRRSASPQPAITDSLSADCPSAPAVF